MTKMDGALPSIGCRSVRWGLPTGEVCKRWARVTDLRFFDLLV
jgi:hypothetical protein